MTTDTIIRDQDLTDEAIKRVAAARVERGLAWLDEHAPEGFVFAVFRLPDGWPFCDEKPSYCASMKHWWAWLLGHLPEKLLAAAFLRTTPSPAPWPTTWVSSQSF